MKSLDRYLINQKPVEPVIDIRYPSKSYSLVPGSCKDCTMKMNCKGNEDNLLHFMRSLGLDNCGDGKIYKVIEKSV